MPRCHSRGILVSCVEASKCSIFADRCQQRYPSFLLNDNLKIGWKVPNLTL